MISCYVSIVSDHTFAIFFSLLWVNGLLPFMYDFVKCVVLLSSLFYQTDV